MNAESFIYLPLIGNGLFVANNIRAETSKTWLEFSKLELSTMLNEFHSSSSGLFFFLALKTGSLDNAIREFSLAKPSWYMSHYTVIYKNGERMRDFLGLFVFIVVLFLVKQLFHSRLLDMRWL